jgi:hypothetical protein
VGFFLCGGISYSQELTGDSLRTEYSSVLISTDPDTAWVLLDGTLRGITPLFLDSLTPGMHRIRLVDRHLNSWFNDATVDSFFCESGGARNLRYTIERRYALITSPAGARVLRSDSLLGTTPLVLPSTSARAGPLLLRKQGFADTTVILLESRGRILVVSMHPVWEAEPSPIVEGRENVGGTRIILAGIGAVVAGAGAAYFKLSADEKNAEYNRTGDPALQAERNRLDAAAAVCLIATQVGVGLLAAFLLAE